ncbi:MAG: ribonuclease P [Candidatus Thermoplasmatota archaeon]
MARRNKAEEKKIAKQRIDRLFQLAEKKAKQDTIHLADRYVEIARKISMKYLVKMPRKYKRRYCKHCYSYFYPNRTCRIRIYRGRVIYYCYNCKKFTRIPLNQKE